MEERRTNDDIEAIIKRAAKAAAKEALRDVGLSDDNAIHDMKELRDLARLHGEKSANLLFIRLLRS